MARVQAEFEAFAPTIGHAATELGMGLAGRRAALKLGIPFVSSYHTSFVAYAEHYRLGKLARRRRIARQPFVNGSCKPMTFWCCRTEDGWRRRRDWMWRDAAIRARACAASKSWDVVWDALLRDYLQLHGVPAPLSLR